MNTADNGANKVKTDEKKKRFTVGFWLGVLVINLFGVFNATDPAKRIFTAIGLAASVVMLFRAWRADKAQAKTKAPQTPAHQ